MKKIFRTKYIVYIVLLCLLGVSVIYFAMSYTGVKIGTINILDELARYKGSKNESENREYVKKIEDYMKSMGESLGGYDEYMETH